MLDEFPSRQDIINPKKSESYRQSIIDQVKKINTDRIDFENSDFKPRQQIIEKQKVFRWSRLFVNEEVSDLSVNDTILINHIPTGEFMESQFICFAKKSVQKDSEGNLVTYDGEEDKRILCLMIDSDKLESDNVKFLRTLFQNTKWYEYQLLKRTELLFTNKRTGQVLEYYDITF